MTSSCISPLSPPAPPIPKLNKATCNAAVPELTATPYLHPQYSANFFSNSSRYFPPVPDIHPDLIQSTTYFSSFPAKYGAQTGILILAFVAIPHLSNPGQGYRYPASE